MAPIEIMKDLFFIERGYLNGNHFVYRSEDPVLIDTGYISDFDLTAELIKNLWVSITIRLQGSQSQEHLSPNKTFSGNR